MMMMVMIMITVIMETLFVVFNDNNNNNDNDVLTGSSLHKSDILQCPMKAKENFYNQQQKINMLEGFMRSTVTTTNKRTLFVL